MMSRNMKKGRINYSYFFDDVDLEVFLVDIFKKYSCTVFLVWLPV